jgi:ribosomal-protein-alanine N-acetyltransferase
MDIEITAMMPQDLAEVAALERSIFSMPWSENGFLSSLQSKDTLYLVVRETGKLIGYCGFLQSFDEADITNVAVSPDYRGRGVGFAMLSELMTRGRARGIARYTLEVRAGNASAIYLYEKLGFHSVGIRKNFYDNPQEDAQIMWTEEPSE